MNSDILAWAEISQSTYISIRQTQNHFSGGPYCVEMDPRSGSATTNKYYSTLQGAVAGYIKTINHLTNNNPENVTDFYADAEVNRRLISTSPQDSAYINAYIRAIRRHQL